MKIMIINPNVVHPMTRDIEKAAREAASPGVEVIGVSPEIGPTAIECHMEFVFASAGVVDTIARAERELDMDAYITACFCDPGLEAAREITSKPVVGIGEAAATFGRMLAPCFSIVTVLDQTVKLNWHRMGVYGMDKFLRSVRSSNVGVLEFREDPERGVAALFEQSKLAVEEDGAKCILLGCAGFAQQAKEFTQKLGVPVLDGVTLAVKLAEDMVQMRLNNGDVLSKDYLKTKQIKGIGTSF